MHAVSYHYTDRSGHEVFLFTQGPEQSDDDVEKLVLIWISRKQAAGWDGEFILHNKINPEW